MIGGAIGNHLLRLQQQSIFSFFSRCFFTSFDVAIEQRVVIDTASPYPTDARKAFPSKASIDIANNCASSNTLLRKSERPPGNHIPTLCLSGNERA
ncbi:MAG: hypothetical protein RXR20_32410 [Paraburkholderia sp.]|jgi:hypothetical protein|uniref:hypothetical protein n=1 Tax=Burkholderiaceae TaxID=119060 RepID=UPI0010F63D62|nr:hypothetical protein [Burkholderia sp. 4M9327F10]